MNWLKELKRLMDARRNIIFIVTVLLLFTLHLFVTKVPIVTFIISIFLATFADMILNDTRK